MVFNYRQIFPSGPVAPHSVAPGPDQSMPTKQQAIGALQHELGLRQTGEMTPELLEAINNRLDEVGDNPSEQDQNFVSMLQGLFDLGCFSDEQAEGPLRRSLQIYSRSLAHNGISVPPGVASAAGLSGAAFMQAYRGISPGTARGGSGSVVEVVGGHIGPNRQCAVLTQTLAPTVGRTTDWLRGDQVMGNTSLQPGTAIATFNFAGGRGQTGYGPEGHREGWYGVSHTGIYLGQDRNGMFILDQYNRSAGAQVRYLKFDDPGAEGASRYFTINTANHQGDHVVHSLPTRVAKYFDRNRTDSPTQLASNKEGPDSKKAPSAAGHTDTSAPRAPAKPSNTLAI